MEGVPGPADATPSPPLHAIIEALWLYTSKDWGLLGAPAVCDDYVHMVT